MSIKAIAMLDVLGFKNMINNEDIEEVFRKYSHLIENAYMSDELMAKYLQTNESFHHVIISDTIAIFPDKYSFDNFLTLINICRLVQYSMFQQAISTPNLFIPIRGAISLGEFKYANEIVPIMPSNRHKTIKNVDILMGKAVINAYEWEKLQDWIGISITEEAKNNLDEYYPKVIKALLSDNTFIEYSVPTKVGDKTSYVINSINKNESSQVITALTNIMNGKDGSVQNKYRNTIEFIKYVDKNNLFYPNKTN